MDISHLLQRNLVARRQRNKQRFQVGDILSAVGFQPHYQIKPFFFFINHPCRLSGKADADDSVQVADIQSVKRQLVFVVAYRNLRQPCNPFELGIRNPFHALNQLQRLIALAHEHIDIVSEYLDGHIAPHACHQLVKAHLYRLREFGRSARNILQGFFHLFHQFLFGLGRCPLFSVFQQDNHVSCLNRHRVGRNFGAPYLGHHHLDFRKLGLEQLLRFGCRFDFLRKRTARGNNQMGCNVPFI
ncbi:hypothetical protein D3C72_1405330 [compost metagenome]